MTTQTPLQSKDLSNINNLKDLRKEIMRIKAIVKLQEKELSERAKKFPEESAIASINGLIHIMVKRGVPANLFNLIRNGIGIMMNIKKQKRGMQGIISQAKELIIYTALTKLFKLYKQKRQNKKFATEHNV